MAVLPLQGSSCFRPKAEPNFPDLPHTPGSCRKWRHQIFQHSIPSLVFQSRNKFLDLHSLILPNPIKNMTYFFHYTEAVKQYSQTFFVVLPCNGRNTSYFLSGLVEFTYACLETCSLTEILMIGQSVEIFGGATFYSFLVCVADLGSLVLPWDGSSCFPVMEELPSQGRPPLHGSWIQLTVKTSFRLISAWEPHSLVNC